MKLTSFSNLKIAKLIPRKVTVLQQSRLQIYIEKTKRAAVNCTTEAGGINGKYFLIPKLWILWKSHFRVIYHPCLSFIGKIPRIHCVNTGLPPFPSVGWAGESGARSQWLTSFQHLPPASTPSMCNYSLFLLLLYSSFCSWDRSNFVLGGDREGALPRKIGISTTP